MTILELLSFVSGKEYRESLESDYQELSLCMKNGAWKAAHILAGSIIEAILVDYLISIGYKKKSGMDPLKMNLGKVIKACKNEGLLSEKTEQLSMAVKTYRQSIHPGRVPRLQEMIDENRAQIAHALVKLVAKEISERKKETYGYTAKQIVTKITGESITISIIDHLLKNMNEFELEQLLLTEIPGEYIELITAEPGASSQDTCEHLTKCFRTAFRMAPLDLQSKIANNFVRILKEESEFLISTYETAFFTGNDLHFLNPEDLKLVKDHMLARFYKEPTEPIIYALEGIGQFLTAGEIANFTNHIVRGITSDKYGDIQTACEMFILNDFYCMNEDIEEKFLNEIEKWANSYESRGLIHQAEKLKAFKAYLEEDPE